MSELFAPSLVEQIAEIDREIALRERVYANWVAAKRLTQQAADRQLARMKAVRQTLNMFQPVSELEGMKPLVLYFKTDEDRDEFTAIIREARPGMIERKL